jgi:hypothetical protein
MKVNRYSGIGASAYSWNKRHDPGRIPLGNRISSQNPSVGKMGSPLNYVDKKIDYEIYTEIG